VNPDLLPDWWDPYSSQPYKLPASEKPRTGSGNLSEYARVAATALAASPAVAWRYATLRPWLNPLPSAVDFVGLSVTPDPRHDDAAVEMIADLGVRNLLFRVPAWESQDLDRYARFMERFAQADFVCNILQSRHSISDRDGWGRQLRSIRDALGHRVSVFWVGNAINRSKWGCRHTGDWLRLMDTAAAAIPERRLAGSSVIDFEPLLQLRTLLNGHRHRFDICAALLYVNRRGSPLGRQYGFFDLARKIRLAAAILSLSNRCSRRLWITETNWPLLDTKPWTPNSGHPRSTVDEQTQADYLTQYFRIARESGFVERVYWWQLINPGYGLVDHRGGMLRKMPSYHAFRALLRN
jgi:hypothetical protein